MAANSFITYRHAKVVAGLFVLTSLAITFLFRENISVRTAFGDISVTVASCFGVAGLIYALQNSGKQEKNIRLAFALMALGLIFDFLAEVAWTTSEVVLHEQPFPSFADALYLMYYPLFALGVMFLPADRLSKREQNKIIIDIVIIMAAATLIFWDFIISPIIVNGGESILALALSIAYPALDIVLLFALIELLYRRWNSLHLVPMLFFIAAITVSIISDIYFSIQSSTETYISGGLIDLGYVLSYFFFGLAGIYQAEEWRLHPKVISKVTRYDESTWTRYLPYLGISAAYLLLAWNPSHLRPMDSLITTLGIGGIIGLVILRQITALNENNSLYLEVKKENEDRRAAEDRLKSLLHFHNEMLDTAAIWIDMFDDHGNTTFWNLAAERISGYTREEVLGNARIWEWLYPDRSYRSEMIETVKAMLVKNKRLENYETVVRCKDGQERIIRWHTNNFVDTSGKILGGIGIGDDVTERKMAEEALKNSERRLAEIIDFLPDATFVIDIDGKVISWNRAIEEMTGVGRNDMIGQGDHIYTVPFYGERRPQLLDLLDKDDEEIISEYQYVQRKGNILYAEVFTPALHGGKGAYVWATGGRIYDVKGNRIGAIESIRDITERKIAEEALQKSEAQLSNAMKIANLGHWELDVPSSMFTFTDNFYAIFHTNAKEIGGYKMTVADYAKRFVHPEDSPLVGEEVQRAIETDDPNFNRYLEHRMLYADGGVGHIAVRFFIVKDENGKTVKAYGVNQDITERKRAEEALRQANRDLKIAIDQARKATAAKSEFLANMSHEIRTPLNGIIGMIGLLMESNLSAEQHEYAEIAHISSETLLSLINDILDLSKIEARKLELEMQDFDLGYLLKETKDLLAIGAHEKGLDLICTSDSAVPLLLRGDPGRLRQILLNLGGNAVKFTAFGKIVIRACMESEDKANATIRFSVSDTGIGIPADRQDILFTPFTQVDSSTTRKYGGTGLGLTISKQLAELMGGRIGVDSQEGIGSTFWFTAVFEKQPSGNISADEKPLEIGDNGDGVTVKSIQSEGIGIKRAIRILVVEDNPVNQKVAKIMLKKMGHRADVVANGREAINALQISPYELVLMDCQMPEMDGFEATRSIRHEGSRVRNPLVPIIAMTASAMEGDREKCIKAGMSDFIGKPVQQRELAEKLARWLPK